MNIDLHTHTTYSDGLLTPKELIQCAVERKLAAVAITDHDEVAGIEEAVSMGQSLGIEVIAGIEISTLYKGLDVHVLGYFIDYKSKIIQDYIKKSKVWRKKRARKIVNKLHKMGIRLPFDLVLFKAGDGCIGRPHIADAMVEQGYVLSFQEAFEKYLADNKPAFVAKTQIETREAISKIQSAGGLTFLAHPSVSLLEHHIYDIIKLGLDGIETVHPRHTPFQVDQYREIVRKNGLLECGGSDTHGNRRGDETLGTMNVPYDILQEMKRKLRGEKNILLPNFQTELE